MTKLITAYKTFPSDIAADLKMIARDIGAFIALSVFIASVLTWAGHLTGAA